MSKEKISKRRRFFLVSFLASFGLLSACFSRVENKPPEVSQDSNETAFEIPTPNVNLAKPLEVSKEPKDVALCEKINQIIEQSEFANARWGVIAIGLKDGRAVCERDARKLFNPASIEKNARLNRRIRQIRRGFSLADKSIFKQANRKRNFGRRFGNLR